MHLIKNLNLSSHRKLFKPPSPFFSWVEKMGAIRMKFIPFVYKKTLMDDILRETYVEPDEDVGDDCD